MREVEPSLRAILRIVLVIVVVLLALYVVYLLRRPITWLVIAGFIAVALSGPVNFLSRRMKRGFAIALTYLGLVLLPFAAAAILIPPLVSELDDLVADAPQYARDVSDFVQRNETLSGLEEKYDITGKLEQEAAELPSRIGDAAGLVRDLGVGLVNSVFAGVTILILSIFMVGGSRRWIDRAIESQPAERAERLHRARERIATAVGNYVGGALLQATLAGVTTFVVLTILGVPFAAPLAVMVALLDLIPLVGATLGAIIVGIVTLFDDFPTVTIIWVIWAIVYQQLENNLVQPQIQRRAVKLEPIVVLISVLFGSTLFGVLGALLAIPLAASATIAVREWLAFRRDTLAREPDAADSAGLPPGPRSTGGPPGPAGETPA